MRHLTAGRKLNRTTGHRKALFRNMVTSLLRHEKIETTKPKAKELRRVAEKVITIAKRGKSNAHVEVYKTVKDKEVIKKLFTDIAPRVASRNGGYTRILPTGYRRGDCADMAIIELVDKKEQKEVQKAKADNKEKKTATKKTKEAKVEKAKEAKQESAK